MPKLKLYIDNDINFFVFRAEMSAFGCFAEVGTKFKKTGTNDVISTPSPTDISELPLDQHEEIQVDHKNDNEE